VLDSCVRSAVGRRRKRRARPTGLRVSPRGGFRRGYLSRVEGHPRRAPQLDRDRPWDALLDELLLETFPASDPLPFSYRRP